MWSYIVIQFSLFFKMEKKIEQLYYLTPFKLKIKNRLIKLYDIDLEPLKFADD